MGDTNSDKVQKLYDALNSSDEFKGGYDSPEKLKSVLDNPEKAQKLYDVLNASNDFKGGYESFDKFQEVYGLKKKHLPKIQKLLESMLAKIQKMQKNHH